jgi:uncharacterized protein YjbI with pentapeptide repeats
MSEYDRMESNVLRHQDLRGIDLTGSDLRGASLRDTDLRDVDFAGSRGELADAREELSELRERSGRQADLIIVLEKELDDASTTIAYLQRANTTLECERDDLRVHLDDMIRVARDAERDAVPESGAR